MGSIRKYIWTWVIFTLLHAINYNACGSIHDDLRMTYSAKMALDKFRKIMLPRLPHKYMKEDIYLIKWLRAQNFDTERAEDMLMQNLKWRRENKMDNVQSQDWSDMEAEYPYTLDSMDKQGQPVLIVDIGEWDLRRASLVGKMPRLIHYFETAVEKTTIKIRELQSAGKNVTRFVFILDMNSFNLAQHTCPPCVARMVQFLSSFDNHYPGYIDKILLINTGPALEIFLNIAKATMGPDTQAGMHVFNKDKLTWQKYLLKIIDSNQLPKEFGGLKE